MAGEESEPHESLAEAAVHKIDDIAKSLADKAEQLEASKRLGPLVGGTKRFFEIEGLDLGGLLAIELFTTVIPLVLIGFSWASDFRADLSFGDFMIDWMELKGSNADVVRDLFGTTASLRSTWTVVGLAGFLVWGIPMASQVAKTYARAFRRDRWPFWTEVWRGSLWFALLLLTYVLTGLVTRNFGGTPWHFLFVLLGLLPSFLLWSISPAILIRAGSAGWRHLAWAGLAGVLLDTLGARVALRWVFPSLLSGWVGFGPIGVTMAMMTTCGIIAVLWVATASLGAVLWERNAPSAEVIASQVLYVPPMK